MSSINILIKIEKNMEMLTNYIEDANKYKNKIDKYLVCDEYNDIKEICEEYVNHIALLNDHNIKIKNILLNINKKKYTICKHEITEDLIDINSERSIIIKYCKHCFYTF